MKWSSLSITTKFRLLISSLLCLTIALLFLFIQFLYESLYVEKVEQSLVTEGKQIAAHYHTGEISDFLIGNVNWHNTVSEAEILIFHDPAELNGYSPFSKSEAPIISKKERAQLLKGRHIVKKGYEEKFERNLIGAIIPLIDQQTKALTGIVYLYLPLASLDEVFTKATNILVIVAVIIFLLLYFIGSRITKSIIDPLKNMKRFSHEIAGGNFSTRIPISANDEIGHVADAFNSMASSLEKADEQKREFLANVAHELRTPLSYVKGYSEILHDESLSKNEHAEYLSLIERETNRMNELVKDLLDLSQLQAEAYPLQKAPLVLAQVIEETIDVLSLSAHEKNMTVHSELNVDVIMNGNESRLKQVFYNIIHNAIRYTNKGGSIFVKMDYDSKQIYVEISDTGIGITGDDLERLGERFFRADKARTREKGGTGLGLAIAKQIVQRHDGTLHISSIIGKGTTVTLAFPYEIF
ncbi:HAMP domain-containing protein [Priestia megaterium]|nr:HAMP domain-containing protein [Priestia megaterium]